MAISNMYTVNTGTATTGDVLTYSTGTTSGGSTWTAGPIHIYDPKPQIKIKDAYAGTVKETIDDIFKKKAFWDNVEWKEFKTWRPRRSITGKIIIGKMHSRKKNVAINGATYRQQFAKTKELFKEKLKGRA